MTPYADTNFFSRVYLALPDSDAADRLLEAACKGDSPPLPITWLHQMELANAFALSVWMGKQGGQKSAQGARNGVGFLSQSPRRADTEAEGDEPS